MFIQQVLVQLKRTAQRLFQRAEQRFKAWTQPVTDNVVSGIAADLRRTRSELIAENAFLRQQLIVCQRQIKQPHLTQHDRRLLVILASRIRGWKSALMLVTPTTLLGWHRQGCRLFWRWKSRPAVREPRIAAETVALIKTMAIDNWLWGAKRIRGELHLQRILTSYKDYFNQARPHQGIGQRIPERLDSDVKSASLDRPVIAVPVLGGLHHDYRRAA